MGTTPTQTGFYSRNGAYCLYSFYVALGAGASFAGCGTITVAAPFAMLSFGSGCAGSSYGVAGGTLIYAGTLWISAGATTINMIISVYGVWSAAVPAVWQAGDTIRGSIWYPLS